MKRLIFLFPTLVMATASLWAEDFSVDGIYYNITDEANRTVEVSYQGSNEYSYSNEYTGSVTIPESVTYNGSTYSVTSIGNWAFSYCTGLTSVTIPNSVTSIGYSAFSSCYGLTSVTIGNSVTEISSEAFYECTGLTSVTIPNSVTEIGSSAFRGCTSLTEVTIPNSVTEIGGGAFQYCTGLTKIEVDPNNPNYSSLDGVLYNKDKTQLIIYPGGKQGSFTIPNSVTSIGFAAFWYCSGLTSVTIPNSVTEIGSEAFSGCTGLTSVTIPNSVTAIGNNAFNDCTGLTLLSIGSGISSIGENIFSELPSLTNLTIADSDAYLLFKKDIFSSSPIKTLYLGRILSGISFQGNTTLTELTIGNSITSIGESAFKGCTGLTEVTIPESVSWIGHSAFEGTPWYTNQPDGVIYINKVLYAYKGTMPENTSIEIKEGTASISNYAFSDCTGLTSVTIGNSVTSIGYAAFYGCTGLTSITIPNSVTSIRWKAFYNCTGLKEVTIPNSVTSMDGSAFSGCTGLTTLSIGSGISTIESLSFDKLPLLTSLTIADSDANLVFEKDIFSSSPIKTLYLGRNLSGVSFQMETTLEELTINIPTIAEQAYQGYTSIKKLTLGNRVTSIETSAFEGCTGLTSLNIGSGISTIGKDVFSNLPSLASLTIADSDTDLAFATNIFSSSPIKMLYLGRNLSGVSFQKNTTLTELTIGNSVTSIGSKAFYKCTRLKEVTIPNSVTEIGDYAFYNCTVLKAVHFNATNCTTMGSYDYPVFGGCTNLTTVTIGENVTTIPGSAFSSCSGLTEVTIPDSVTSIGGDAFSDCTGLTEVTIGNSVTEIGSEAFYQCTGLIEVTIPNSVTSIGFAAFKYCDGLTEVTIGNSVTEIGSEAFYQCTGLIEVTIPNSVTSIGFAAFWHCTGLTRVYTLAPTPPSIGNGTFDCYSRATLYTPQESKAAYQQADGWKEFSRIGYPCILSIPSVNEEGGSMEAIDEIYPDSYPVTFSATPAEGNYVRWNDGNTDNPRTITITSDTTFTAQFEKCRTLTVNSADPSMGSVSGSGNNYRRGETVNITATPTKGYYFYQWNDGVTDNPRQVTVENDSTFTATFSDMCLLKLLVNDSSMGSVLGGKDCVPGSTVRIMARPNAGHYFVQWSDGNTEATRSVVMDKSLTLTAEFERYRSVTLSVNDEAMGSTTGSGTEYRKGESVEITATPAEGHIFVQWSDGKTNNPRTVVTDEDVVLTAEFERYRILTVEPNNNEWGSTSGNGTFPRGSHASISATPAEGYYFVQWNDGIKHNPRTVTVVNDTAFTAEFSNKCLLTLQVNDEAMGSVSGAQVYDYMATANIVATPAEGHYFVQWNDGSSEANRSIVMDTVRTYTATFERYRSVTLAVNDETMGSTTGSGTEYRKHESVEITATPAEGHIFVQWSDGKTNNPRTVVTDEDVALTAEFERYRILTVESNNNEWGSTSGSGTFPRGSHTSISATPAEGYYLAQWSDGYTYSPRPVTISDDITITAEFERYRVLSATPNHESWGSLSGMNIYKKGEVAILTATPAERCLFKQWSDGNTDNPRVLVMTNDVTLSAEFAKNCIVTLLVNDESRGFIFGDGTYRNGQVAQLDAIPNSGYKFRQWSDGNTDNPRLLTVEEDITLTAFFVVEGETLSYQLDLQANDPSMGTVTGSGIYNYGSVVTIEAIPSSGYEFRHWSDGNTDNPREVVVTDDMTLTATFTTVTEIGGIDESELKIYTTNGALHIDNAVGGEEITICDLSGRAIQMLRAQEGYNRIDLDITGVYLVRVGLHIVKVHF